MKLFLKLLMLLVIAAVAAPMVIKDSDGKPLLSPEQLLPVALLPEPLKALLQHSPLNTKMPTHPTSKENGTGNTNGTTVYRWQDAEGNLHYSDRANHQNAQQTVIQHTNQVQAYQPKSKAVETNTVSNERTNPAPVVKMPSSNLSGTLSLSDTEALMKQAQETQRILQERQAQIDALLKAQTQ